MVSLNFYVFLSIFYYHNWRNILVIFESFSDAIIRDVCYATTKRKNLDVDLQLFVNISEWKLNRYCSWKAQYVIKYRVAFKISCFDHSDNLKKMSNIRSLTTKQGPVVIFSGSYFTKQYWWTDIFVFLHRNSEKYVIFKMSNKHVLTFSSGSKLTVFCWVRNFVVEVS